MNIEIINIGDELLIGQVINTNASWMGEQLGLAGFKAHQFTVIGDSREQILEALGRASERCEVILISGGIGPTKDDITKTTLCEFFETSLVFDEEAFMDVENLFSLRGYKVTELNRQQAFLPANCKSIPNRNGTARGMWFEKEIRTDGRQGKTVFVSMPGVPFEIKAMMTDYVIPELTRRFHPKTIYHKTILTQGIGESFLASIIEKWEDDLPAWIKLAYLPQPGIVRLRLTGTGDDRELVRREVEIQVEKLSDLIPEYIFGTDDDCLEAIVGQILLERNQTLATAESCTGGYIAHLLTSIPGSSGYFRGSVIAYDNTVKENLLGVMPETILKFGAVSSEVVTEMAIGAQTSLNTDYVIAVSGIAGPGGGTAEKPVGTIWIAIATPDEVFSHQFHFGDSRDRNIRRTALQALNMLRKKLTA
jgi:nicotinamide-nucleotide amidase